MQALLAADGYDASICARIVDVASGLDEHVGAILVTEEALTGDLSPLEDALAAQPGWSDIPFVVLAVPQDGRSRPEPARLRLPPCITNATVIERPLGAGSLISSIASAMRSRQRQLEMRDRLRELDASRQALVESEAELRLVTDALPVLIAFVDRDLRYRFANAAYSDWFYCSPAEMIGRTVQELVGVEGFAFRREPMERALAGEAQCLEFPFPHRDGRRRDAEVRYLPRRRADGQIDGFHIFTIDITDRKRAAEELEQRVAERTAALEQEMASRARAEAALRQSQKMEAVGQLTGGIAHDFNNMLTGVIGAMDIMKRRLASGRIDDLDRFMDAAAVSAQRAAALTARLLAFSRRQSLDTKPTDVNALTLSLEELLARSVHENISLRIVPGIGVPQAMTDPNQFENAILNLVINARDAMPDGGKLTIETSLVELDEAYAVAKPDVKPGRYVVVAVSDTGVGMPPEVLERIFEPFFSTKPAGQGTGLGLSMIYGFAQQSGGQVRVHSQAGQGTSVKLYLPVAASAEREAEPHARAPAQEGSGQTVLLVEDDDSVRLLVREVLEELSYHTLEASNGDQAIPILMSGRHIDLLVSDVGLPGINGRQLAELARRQRPDLPVLFVTGYAENAAIRSHFLGTNMDMITKPFAIADLSAKIARMVRREG